MPVTEPGQKIPRALSVNDALFIRTLSYNKLPQQLLTLYIVKLDGSSFDVQISNNSTVRELKLAVEEVFTWSPKVGKEKISWSHVWGHFCLCFEGQELINEKITIKSLEIKDGDRLKFVRHFSAIRRPEKQLSKSRSSASGSHQMMSSKESAGDDGGNVFGNDKSNTDAQDNNSKAQQCEEEDAIPKPKLKLTHVLKGWFSIPKLWAGRRKRAERGNSFRQ